jgi:hypothetical protein
MVTLDVFIHQENISLYKKLLSDGRMNELQRRVISKLLADEEAKLLDLFSPQQAPLQPSRMPGRQRSLVNADESKNQHKAEYAFACVSKKPIERSRFPRLAHRVIRCAAKFGRYRGIADVAGLATGRTSKSMMSRGE